MAKKVAERMQSDPTADPTTGADLGAGPGAGKTTDEDMGSAPDSRTPESRRRMILHA